MREFVFKESDKEGAEILESVTAAPLFNKWMYDTIVRYCSGKILEIGSGTGNISEFFIKDNKNINLSDVRKEYCDILLNKFPSQKDQIFLMDLVKENFDSEYASLIGTFDTVFALNVIEHIKDNQKALTNCHKLLKPGGTIIILVPAYEWLYNVLDEELYHYQRYTKSTLEDVLKRSSFRIEKSFYFNFVGMAGWFYAGKILKEKTLTKNKMSLYNKLVPINKLLDRIIFNSAGLSVVSVGIKSK